MKILQLVTDVELVQQAIFLLNERIYFFRVRLVPCKSALLLVYDKFLPQFLSSKSMRNISNTTWRIHHICEIPVEFLHLQTQSKWNFVELLYINRCRHCTHMTEIRQRQLSILNHNFNFTRHERTRESLLKFLLKFSFIQVFFIHYYRNELFTWLRWSHSYRFHYI